MVKIRLRISVSVSCRGNVSEVSCSICFFWTSTSENSDVQ